MLFIFGEFDNQLRRQKSMAGIKEHLLQGQWCSAVPIGYDILKQNRERKIVVNQSGAIIKKMFYWKAKERQGNLNRAATILQLWMGHSLASFKSTFSCL